MTHLFVDGLTVIDCSFLHPQRGIIGESWLVDVVLSGNLDEEGVVFDFSLAKKAIKSTIDATADHALIVPTLDPRLELQQAEGQTLLHYRDDRGLYFQYTCPDQGLCLIEAEAITPESVITYLKKEILAILPANVTDLSIELRNEVVEGPTYQYSHGLKKHYGNCQRMAHGHRSRIMIFKENERQFEVEKEWAKRWSDIYLGSAEDLFSEKIIEGKAYYHFVYTGNQGPFSLTIAKEICEIIDTDTTVELLGHYIHKTLAKSQQLYTVKAFEGIEKGALIQP